MCLGIGVVATTEVAIERCDNAVLVAFADVVPLPLPDTGTASVGQHVAADFLQDRELAIPRDGLMDHIRTRCHQEGHPHLQTLVQSLLGDTRCAADILVGAVRATADESRCQMGRVTLPRDFFRQLADRARHIRRVRTHDVRL